MKRKILSLLLVGLLAGCSPDPMLELYRHYDREEAWVCFDGVGCLGESEYFTSDPNYRLPSINVPNRQYFYMYVPNAIYKNEAYSITVHLDTGQITKQYTFDESRLENRYDYINYILIYGDESEIPSLWNELQTVENELSRISLTLENIYNYYNN